MRITEFWRTARFRQTVIYGSMFALILAGMLGLIYVQTAVYLGRQADKILSLEAHSLAMAAPDALPGRIDRRLAQDPRHIELYGLFSRDGVWITGNVRAIPAVRSGGSPRELGPRDGFRAPARVLATRLPWGEVLVVGRVSSQLAEFRAIIVSALLWSGGLMAVVGLVLGTTLSINPLRRIQAVREASARVTQGDLGARLPIAGRRDELDMLAGIVNQMMDEIERLVAEAKSVGDVVAHDLRTPLTRLHLLLSRLRQAPDLAPEHEQMLDRALTEADTLLGRFRAILRISEIENQRRRAGFRRVDLTAVLLQAEELYAPLAEDKGLTLETLSAGPAVVQGDPDLIFEAFGNLVDNAIKFTPKGGAIWLALSVTGDGPELAVVDNGPGVVADDRSAVTGRFYRSRRDQTSPGAGLGLSIVSAIAHLHGFALTLEDAEPGLRVAIECWPRPLGGA